jgi:hypothetical protein
MKTYVAMYRVGEEGRAAERIRDETLPRALAQARWRTAAVAAAHGLPRRDVDVIGIEELTEDEPASELARAAVLACRLAGTRSEAHRLVVAAMTIVGQRVELVERPQLRTA